MIGRSYDIDLAVTSSSLMTSSSGARRRSACSAFGIDQLLGLTAAAAGPDDVIVTSSPSSQSQAAALESRRQLESPCRCLSVNNVVDGWTNTSAAALLSVSSLSSINRPTACIDRYSQSRTVEGREQSPVTVTSCCCPPVNHVVEDWITTSSLSALSSLSSTTAAAAAFNCSAVRARLGVTDTDTAVSSHCSDTDVRPAADLRHRTGQTISFLRAIAECFARLRHRLGVRLSVCLSVTPWHYIKTMQATMTKSLLWAAPRSLVCRDKISCH